MHGARIIVSEAAKSTRQWVKIARRTRLRSPGLRGIAEALSGRLAQMDRASVSEAEGHWFESSTAHQFSAAKASSA